VIIENHIFTRGYATHENIAFYDHAWNKFLSYTNIQQISSIYFFLHNSQHIPTNIVWPRTNFCKSCSFIISCWQKYRQRKEVRKLMAMIMVVVTVAIIGRGWLRLRCDILRHNLVALQRSVHLTSVTGFDQTALFTQPATDCLLT